MEPLRFMVNPCRTHFYCRAAALREGLAVLEAGALSHNHLDFYWAAMEAMLGAGISEGAAIVVNPLPDEEAEERANRDGTERARL